MYKMLKRGEVEQICKISRSAIYRLMRSNKFPAPIKIGDKAVRWRESEVYDFLDSRPRATGENGDGEKS